MVQDIVKHRLLSFYEFVYDKRDLHYEQRAFKMIVERNENIYSGLSRGGIKGEKKVTKHIQNRLLSFYDTFQVKRTFKLIKKYNEKINNNRRKKQ
jgi:hypothetical protein